MPPTRLYLPITRLQAESLSRPDQDVGPLVSTWPIPSIAAALVIQGAASVSEQANPCARLERMLAGLIDAGIELVKAGQADAFGSLIAAKFDHAQFECGLALLHRLGVRLLELDEITAGGFTGPEGRWDFGFSSRHLEALSPFTEPFQGASGQSFNLAPQQARAFRVFKAELDEDFHIQALAGTGKTFLIERLVDSLADHRPLILVMTKAQLDALQSRIGAGRVTGMTFSEFAVRSLRFDVGRPGQWKSNLSPRRTQVDMAQVAQHLAFHQVGALTASQVASAAYRAVFKFCSSRDTTIGAHHIPVYGSNFSPAEKAVLVECAQRLWDETVRPVTSGLELPIRGYHRIKELSLSPTACVEPHFTHVVVDEAHDMPVPIAQFLDRCRLPVITLGDSCQRLDGAVAERATRVRRRELFHSLRSGRDMEGAVNALIENNPVLDLHPLEGNRQLDTRVTYYPTNHLPVPEEPTTILVWSGLNGGCLNGSSAWQMQRLDSASYPVVPKVSVASFWTVSTSTETASDPHTVPFSDSPHGPPCERRSRARRQLSIELIACSSRVTGHATSSVR
ncbi:TPA: helicase [Pseudomonas aeruginosa]